MKMFLFVKNYELECNFCGILASPGKFVLRYPQCMPCSDTGAARSVQNFTVQQHCDSVQNVGC